MSIKSNQGHFKPNTTNTHEHIRYTPHTGRRSPPPPRNNAGLDNAGLAPRDTATGDTATGDTATGG